MNRLSKEKSQYLRLHADNPVDWYPWGEEAFEKARSEDKPIMLSIGYYSCHWCHVMNREVFMDPDVASYLNRHYVCIKVDREERPDIDSIYMKYAIAIMGSGGWPLNLVLTHDLKPYYAFTYLPKEDFLEVMERLYEIWISNREELNRYSQEIYRVVMDLSRPPTIQKKPMVNRLMDIVAYRLIDRYDPIYGGFGTRPKFPLYHNLRFLIKYWYYKRDEKPLSMALETLLKIRFSSLYDHIGGGVHRYAVNRDWSPPHFEKMLYDQAWLIEASIDAYKITGEDVFRQMILSTYRFLEREMKGKDGLYYSSLSAESEDGEGSLYLWTLDEIGEAADIEILNSVYSFNGGNYVDEFGRLHDDIIIFHIDTSNYGYSRLIELYRDTYRMIEQEYIPRLLEYRVRNKRRMPPDKKILVDWNSMVISSFSKASYVTGLDNIGKSAVNAYRDIIDIWGGLDILPHTVIDGEPTSPAIMDDYAYLIRASIDLYEATFDSEYISNAVELTEEALSRFYDDNIHVLYFNEGREIDRYVEDADGAYPAGYGIMIENLLRLNILTGIEKYRGVAKKLIDTVMGKAWEYPSMYIGALTAAMDANNWIELIISPKDSSIMVKETMDRLAHIYAPNLVTILVDKSNKYLPEYAKAIYQSGRPGYYLCKGGACKPPLNRIEEVISQIQEH